MEEPFSSLCSFPRSPGTRRSPSRLPTVVVVVAAVADTQVVVVVAAVDTQVAAVAAAADFMAAEEVGGVDILAEEAVAAARRTRLFPAVPRHIRISPVARHIRTFQAAAQQHTRQ